MPEVQLERPAYITFALKPVEDREQTIKTGMFTLKDEEFVYITPPGSKDRIERKVSEWLPQIRDQMKQDRLPLAFVQYYESAYKEWKETGEVPLHGTYIKNVAIFSPAQIETMLKAGIKTVEDLAAANEESISRLGMGGRALKMQAENWLKSGSQGGAQAAQLTALQLQNEELTKSNKELAEQVKTLATQLEALVSGVNSKPAQKVL
jgi:hypothetical protein